MSKPISIPNFLAKSGLMPQEETLAIPYRSHNLFIGLPKESSTNENRVALVPASVATLVAAGHRIVIEMGAGERSKFTDLEYSEAGAEIAYSQEEVFRADIILKVAPIHIDDVDYLRPNQIVVAPIHVPTLTHEIITRLKQKRVIAVAMDYIKDVSGAFPFIRAVSEIAGISAVLTAAELLSNAANGRGVLLGGISGVPSAKVVIIGAGVVAECAARTALGLGAEVHIFDNNIYKLMRIQHHLNRQMFTSTLNPKVLEQDIINADVVIGALHSKTGRTPVVVSETTISKMRRGAIIIDASIDQGGVFATSRITSHEKPTFTVHDVIHYCVPNIASRVSQTSSTAVSNILTPMLFQVSDAGSFESLIIDDLGFRSGVYTYKGCLTNQHIGERFQMKSTELSLLLTNSF